MTDDLASLEDFFDLSARAQFPLENVLKPADHYNLSNSLIPSVSDTAISSVSPHNRVNKTKVGQAAKQYWR